MRHDIFAFAFCLFELFCVPFGSMHFVVFHCLLATVLLVGMFYWHIKSFGKEKHRRSQDTAKESKLRNTASYWEILNFLLPNFLKGGGGMPVHHPHFQPACQSVRNTTKPKSSYKRLITRNVAESPNFPRGSNSDAETKTLP